MMKRKSSAVRTKLTNNLMSVKLPGKLLPVTDALNVFLFKFLFAD